MEISEELSTPPASEVVDLNKDVEQLREQLRAEKELHEAREKALLGEIERLRKENALLESPISPRTRSATMLRKIEENDIRRMDTRIVTHTSKNRINFEDITEEDLKKIRMVISDIFDINKTVEMEDVLSTKMILVHVPGRRIFTQWLCDEVQIVHQVENEEIDSISFDALVFLVNFALQNLEVQNATDYISTKLLLEVSERIFHRAIIGIIEDGTPLRKKEYLKHLIREATVFQSLFFWEEYFWDYVGDEFRLKFSNDRSRVQGYNSKETEFLKAKLVKFVKKIEEWGALRPEAIDLFVGNMIGSIGISQMEIRSALADSQTKTFSQWSAEITRNLVRGVSFSTSEIKAKATVQQYHKLSTNSKSHNHTPVQQPAPAPVPTPVAAPVHSSGEEKKSSKFSMPKFNILKSKSKPKQVETHEDTSEVKISEIELMDLSSPKSDDPLSPESIPFIDIIPSDLDSQVINNISENPEPSLLDDDSTKVLLPADINDISLNTQSQGMENPIVPEPSTDPLPETKENLPVTTNSKKPVPPPKPSAFSIFKRLSGSWSKEINSSKPLPQPEKEKHKVEPPVENPEPIPMTSAPKEEEALPELDVPLKKEEVDDSSSETDSEIKDKENNQVVNHSSLPPLPSKSPKTKTALISFGNIAKAFSIKSESAADASPPKTGSETTSPIEAPPPPEHQEPKATKSKGLGFKPIQFPNLSKGFSFKVPKPKLFGQKPEIDVDIDIEATTTVSSDDPQVTKEYHPEGANVTISEEQQQEILKEIPESNLSGSEEAESQRSEEREEVDSAKPGISVIIDPSLEDNMEMEIPKNIDVDYEMNPMPIVAEQ